MSLIFFDTEFTGLHKNTTLISIGLVSDDGRKFYAELTDYDKSQCDDWIKSNVINNLFLHYHTIGERPETAFTVDGKQYAYGNKIFVATHLRKWLSQFEEVQLVSDVCHYDMVLLIDIFGGAFDLPPNVCASCHDINQDIATWTDSSEKEAFNFSREDFVKYSREYDRRSFQPMKHNALHDAEIIKEIFEIIHTKEEN